jgi:hypothetical protein
MLNTALPDTAASPKPQPASLWSKYGLLAGLGLPFLLAIPVWMIAFPQSYDRAVDSVVDAFAAVALVLVAALFLRAIVRSRGKFRPLGYAVALASAALASVAGWNLIALYTKLGTVPVTLFGWGISAQPWFYVLLFIAVLGLGAEASRVLGKGRPSQ